MNNTLSTNDIQYGELISGRRAVRRSILRRMQAECEVTSMCHAIRKTFHLTGKNEENC